MIEGVRFPGGRHCETTTAGALLRHGGLTLSEPMLFGLGEGLGFVYWDAKNLPFPFLGGRSKPGQLTRTLTAHLGVTLRVAETGSATTAWRSVADALDRGRPVGLQLDSFFLEYFRPRVHFGGHYVAAYGYDDEVVHLVDTAQQGGVVRTSRSSLRAAREWRGPMAARRLSYTVEVPASPPDLAAILPGAIRRTAETFLQPPIANLGWRGIATAAVRVRRWQEVDVSQVAMLMEHGGTGGALFRNLYRDFLAEAATIVDDAGLRRGHELYAQIAPRWTEVSQLIAAGDLAGASRVLAGLAEREREAMRVLAGVG